MPKNQENVKVVVRFRPLNEREKKEGEMNDFKLKIHSDQGYIDIGRVSESGHHDKRRFIFDQVFGMDTTQEQMFDSMAKDALNRVGEGYNATILTYGVTSSGKTYTLFGHENGRKELAGIIPRSCDYLFSLINNNDDVVEAHVKCSFLEIYREHVQDLLIPRKMNDYSPSLRIRHNSRKGVYVQGLIEKYVYTPKDILQTIKEGAMYRSTASTALNNVSSRSHAVLTLTITQILTDGSEISSKLNLVDLAGSENVGKSQAEGTTLLEAQMINKSLSSLGNVIYALTEKGREHIPYRDSKLTFLLQDSLGGNSKTILITTASPHSNAYSETLNTLNFAKRAKEIKNIPKVNRNESNANLLRTVEKLREQLAELQAKYEDATTIIQKVEVCEMAEQKENMKESVKRESKKVVLYKAKAERHEKKIEELEKRIGKEKQRQGLMRDAFNQQRELTNRIARNLYHERNHLCKCKHELEMYKSFYSSLKEALKTPDILRFIVGNANFSNRRPPPIDTDLLTPISYEINSPNTS